MKRMLLKLSAAVALAAPAAVPAAQLVFTADMNAAQEVQLPAVNSPATASFHALYDTDTNIFSFLSMVGSGLVGSTITGFHIHAPAAIGQNASVALDFDHNSIVRFGNSFFFSAQNVGGTGPTARTTFTEDEEAALIAGNAYVNLHTNIYPGGEIRGQLVTLAPVPEPETYALMLAGLGLVGWAARRRRIA